IVARRKRERPEVAAAYPHLPEALASGFLLEIPLGLGRNNLTFQLRDHERIWRTFHSTSVVAVPLSSLTRLGLTNLRSFAVHYLKHLASKRHESSTRQDLATSPSVEVESSSAGKTSNHSARTKSKTIRLFATSKSNLFIIEIGELVMAGFREI